MSVQNPDDIFNEEGDSKTAFNSALDIIQRISRLEYSFSSSWLYENLKEAYQLLILIHSEIDFKLNEEQREELEALEKEISNKLPEAEAKHHSDDGNIYITYPKIRKEVIDSLIELKMKIGRHKYKVGLGMVDMNDPRYALLNG